MRKISLLFTVMAVVLLIGACGSDEKNSSGGKSLLEELQEKGEIKVGFANEKPYAYEEDGELKGAAVEIAKTVLNNLGIEKVEGQLSEFGNLVPGLTAGKFDVITAGMAITPDRCENVAFGEPEIQYGEGLIVQSSNPMDLHSYKDVAANPDIKIAVMSGATEIDFLIREGVDDSQIMRVPDIPASFSAVESGRAHATTGTEMTIKMALESSNNEKLEFVNDFQQPEIEGNPSFGAAAFRIDDKEFREAYNEELAKLKENGEIGPLIEISGFSEEMNLVDLDLTTASICSGENY
ncbi:ectoine/hydroxyectoine ABC transporter substrate-binding protein EhuB [Sporosarcina sp. Marseille-Q4063]|uniref:ectoine/hydroxyectoine ABC transporter substrate-binding protein EhuB n=1 Tax=Sporosarcina sp. Marseille-Q4063 TaxID=2810514 RepID=UPI001BB098C1|nr:ectoine/hydroxyectoine ABC transporter substrate-binding protein EhuB [Sporosarcina sp. Marseille-Q4063]QUW22404.1 ectoine/hydroxyectoine ABC transporter substrate-binding protein EhuB [Sporosarcina sp. Marseille-Q4063]